MSQEPKTKVIIILRKKRSKKFTITPPRKITSEIMRLVKSTNTKPELALRKALWNAGLRGYRLNWNKVVGSPDIAFTTKKIAIFVHGCFWHRCPTCKRPVPKKNFAYWKDKFKKNVSRDKRILLELKKQKWIVFTVWECEIKKNLPRMVNNINRAVIRRSS